MNKQKPNNLPNSIAEYGTIIKFGLIEMLRCLLA
jgi:hypothetical protein